MKRDPWRDGFTLAEILIVVVILVILLMVVLLSLRTQVLRARDARRKADINRIQKAYEEYFNDKQCYPYETALENCGSSDLAPYLRKIPCDPKNNEPYLYVPGSPSLCSGYRVCAKLEDLNDADIARIGCHPTEGCGWSPGFNYCVSVGMAAAAPGAAQGSGEEEGDETVTPTPSLPPEPGEWACTPGGACNIYVDPVGAGCPVTYATVCTYNGVWQCDNPANRCTD